MLLQITADPGLLQDLGPYAPLVAALVVVLWAFRQYILRPFQSPEQRAKGAAADSNGTFRNLVVERTKDTLAQVYAANEVLRDLEERTKTMAAKVDAMADHVKNLSDLAKKEDEDGVSRMLVPRRLTVAVDELRAAVAEGTKVTQRLCEILHRLEEREKKNGG